jgi:hypothetical protein
LTGSLVSDPTPLVPDDGNTTTLPGQTVTLKAHPAGATGYTDVGTATTAADGSFIFPPVKPAKNTSYRAEWAGGTIETITYPPASAGVLVQVKPKITLSVTKYNSRSGKYYRYKLGRTVYLRGALTPVHAGGKVTVTAYRYKAATRTWAKLKSSVRTLTTKSTYTWSWKPTARATYRVVTTFAGDADHIAGSSVYRYIKAY